MKIELGHRATVKKIRSPEGFTHDWTVYVRGPENCNISYFIEKVVFNLHGSFHNPKRGIVVCLIEFEILGFVFNQGHIYMYDILTGYLATSSWSCLLSRILEFIVFDELIFFLLLIGIVC